MKCEFSNCELEAIPSLKCCKEHKCQADLYCVNSMYKDYFCEEHQICKEEACQEYNEGKVYCKDHRCNFYICFQKKLITYCKDHECNVENCDKYSNGDFYCKEHKCEYCEKSKLDCQKHKCRYENCNNTKISAFDFCKVHICYYNTCFNNKDCTLHNCQVENCTKTKTIDKIYCFDHMCHEFDCNKIKFKKKYCKEHYTKYICDIHDQTKDSHEGDYICIKCILEEIYNPVK